MYSPGQIVFGFDSCQPVVIGDDVWNEASYPENTKNFTKVGRVHNERYGYSTDEYCDYYDWGVAIPKSKELAEAALRLGLICVTRPSSEHCPKCFGWKHAPNERCDASQADGEATFARIIAKYGEAAVSAPDSWA